MTNPDGRPGVKAWLDGVDPAQRRLARKLDRLILDAVPKAVSGIKYRKPSQPLGVSFYGLQGNGWIVHMNSLKGRVRLTFFARSALKPAPPLPSPCASRAIDIPADEEPNEKPIKTCLK